MCTHGGYCNHDTRDEDDKGGANEVKSADDEGARLKRGTATTVCKFWQRNHLKKEKYLKLNQVSQSWHPPRLWVNTLI